MAGHPSAVKAESCIRSSKNLEVQLKGTRWKMSSADAWRRKRSPHFLPRVLSLSLYSSSLCRVASTRRRRATARRAAQHPKTDYKACPPAPLLSVSDFHTQPHWLRCLFPGTAVVVFLPPRATKAPPATPKKHELASCLGEIN
jgi:hypothetical protein